MRLLAALAGMMIVVLTPRLTEAEWVTEQDVTVPGEHFAAFKVPPAGSSLRLRIRPESGKDLRTTEFGLQDTSDDVQWRWTIWQCNLHLYEIAGVFSSREWTHVDGTFGKCGAGNAGEGGPGHGAEDGAASPPDFAFDVPGIDLDIEGVTEEHEEAWGGYVRLNDDDDNFNDIPDKNDVAPNVQNPLEDDLLKVILRKQHVFGGNVELSSAAIPNKIKLWTAADKTAPLGLSIPVSAIPDAGLAIWVEGIQESTTARDVELKATYTVGGKTTEDRIKLTVKTVEMKLEKIGNTVINKPNKYSEDTTIKVTPVDSAGNPVLWFSGVVPIIDSTYRYSLNGGYLPSSVTILNGNPVSFVCHSLSHLDGNAQILTGTLGPSGNLTSGYKIYGSAYPINGFLIRQWADDLGVIHNLAIVGSPDWFEARYADIIAGDDGDVAAVLGKVGSYSVEALPNSNFMGEVNPGRRDTSHVLFNAAFPAMRLNSKVGGNIYCVDSPQKPWLRNVILHEARHCYQYFLSNSNVLGTDDDENTATPKNDDDGDFLVDVCPIAPTTITIDSDTVRSITRVMPAGTPSIDCHEVQFQGDNAQDPLVAADRKDVRGALEKDATEFAKMH